MTRADAVTPDDPARVDSKDSELAAGIAPELPMAARTAVVDAKDAPAVEAPAPAKGPPGGPPGQDMSAILRGKRLAVVMGAMMACILLIALGALALPAIGSSGS